MDEEVMNKINEEIVTFIAELGIDSHISISKEESDNEIINIQIETPEAASVIGFHGETLQALQLIFSFLCHKRLDRWVKIVVNVGDYRQKREEQLRKLALNMAMKAKFSGEVQAIPNLNSQERRLVHMILSDNPDVFSESEGEGRQRMLMIKPKK